MTNWQKNLCLKKPKSFELRARLFKKYSMGLLIEKYIARLLSSNILLCLSMPPITHAPTHALEKEIKVKSYTMFDIMSIKTHKTSTNKKWCCLCWQYGRWFCWHWCQYMRWWTNDCGQTHPSDVHWWQNKMRGMSLLTEPWMRLKALSNQVMKLGDIVYDNKRGVLEIIMQRQKLIGFLKKDFAMRIKTCYFFKKLWVSTG